MVNPMFYILFGFVNVYFILWEVGFEINIQ